MLPWVLCWWSNWFLSIWLPISYVVGLERGLAGSNICWILFAAYWIGCCQSALLMIRFVLVNLVANFLCRWIWKRIGWFWYLLDFIRAYLECLRRENSFLFIPLLLVECQISSSLYIRRSTVSRIDVSIKQTTIEICNSLVNLPIHIWLCSIYVKLIKGARLWWVVCIFRKLTWEKDFGEGIEEWPILQQPVQRGQPVICWLVQTGP